MIENARGHQIVVGEREKIERAKQWEHFHNRRKKVPEY